MTGNVNSYCQKKEKKREKLIRMWHEERSQDSVGRRIR